MSGTNPVGSWALPLSTGPSVQDPTTYKGNLDADAAVAQRVADAFAPRPASPAAMSVVLDAGFIAAESPSGLQSVVEVGPQTVTIAAAPGIPNNRIDLIVVNSGSGAASVIAGTPGNPPSPPSIAAGKRQVALISVPSGTTAIGAANITDLRAVWSGGRAIPWAVASGSADAITASYTPATPNPVPDGYVLGFRALAANATAAPSFAPDGMTAHAITKKGGAALLSADIPGNFAECLLRYNSANARWELLNPAVSLPTIANGQLLANTSGGTTTPVGEGLSSYLDATLGNTRGSIIVRGASGWSVMGPGTAGYALVSNGAGADPSYQQNPGNFAVRGEGVSEFGNDAGYIGITGYQSVGSYAAVFGVSASTTTAGATGTISGFPGTWRCMGETGTNTCPCGGNNSAFLYQRIA